MAVSASMKKYSWILLIGVLNLASFPAPVVAFTPDLLTHMTTGFRGPYSEVDPSNVSAVCEKALTELIGSPVKLVEGKSHIGELCNNCTGCLLKNECPH